MSTKTSAPAEMEGIIEAFDEISGLCRHLRQGGPVPEDLQELSDALHEAVGIAANMLHTLAQQPAADQFIATFRCENNGIVGTTDAKVHSVTRHDDGRIEVVIDHWPEQPAADCTCPHQDAREPHHDVACPARRTHPAITHCDNCGLDWLDNGLNPVGCPYCKQRELLTLAEQWERDAAGCRRDGYIDAAVVKEDCAQSIRQTLGISAIAKALATKQPAAVDVVQVPRELINDLLAALQGRRGDLHFRLAVLAAQQQGGE